MKFLFYITTKEGERIEWRGLSKKDALLMYNTTDKTRWESVMRGFGWREHD